MIAAQGVAAFALVPGTASPALTTSNAVFAFSLAVVGVTNTLILAAYVAEWVVASKGMSAMSDRLRPLLVAASVAAVAAVVAVVALGIATSVEVAEVAEVADGLIRAAVLCSAAVFAVHLVGAIQERRILS